MPSILNNTGTTLTTYSIANTFTDSLLSVGRQANRSGIGLSSSARQGIEGFLSATQGGYNQLFSLATGPSLTPEGLQTQIKGLRASIPISQLSPKMLEELAKQLAEAEADDTAVSPSDLGNNVDTTA